MQRSTRLLLGTVFTLLVIRTGVIWYQGTSQIKQMPKTRSVEQLSAQPISAVTPETKVAHLKSGNTVDLQQKLQILDEIFQTKNDNDPRLDRELSQLTPAEKRAFEKKYEELQQEARNEKGTIVFLLGRKLDTAEDLAFMKKVMSEPPCLSLEDCKRKAEDSGHDHNASLEISLEYPKFVALKSIEAYLEKNPGRNPISPEVEQILRQAQLSKNPALSQMAISLKNRYQN